MVQIRIEALERIMIKVEEWTSKIDVPRTQYEAYYNQYNLIHDYIDKHPHDYNSEKEYNKACCTSSMIMMHLLLKINMMSEQEELSYQTKIHRRLFS